jgi:transcriptional regulator with XRE-family HTH domain
MFLRHLVYSLRHRKGLTQHELATKAQTTDSTISHIEQGDRTPSTKLATRLACALEEPPETFVRALAAEHWCGELRCPQLGLKGRKRRLDRDPGVPLLLLVALLPWLG